MGNVGIKKCFILKKKKKQSWGFWCLKEVEVVRSVEVSVLDDGARVASHAPANKHTHSEITDAIHTLQCVVVTAHVLYLLFRCFPENPPPPPK